MSGMLLADWFNGAAGRTVPVADAARILDTVSASPSLQVWMQTAQVGSLIGSALFEQERERYGGNAELQFRPTDRLEIIARPPGAAQERHLDWVAKHP